MIDNEVLDSFIEEGESVQPSLVDLRIRAIAFLLDYTALIALIFYTNRFIEFFFTTIDISVLYVIIGIYSILFVLMEQKYNGSFFKRLLKIKNVSMEDEKLGLHIFIAKLLLRPIAFLVALVYLKFCFAILLWIFGIYKPLFKFLNGEIFILWYDYSVKQMTVKVV